MRIADTTSEEPTFGVIRLPLRIPATPGRLLVLSPHPDDETLAAGGLLHDLTSIGWRTMVVVATDGAASHPGVDELTNVRAAECTHACEALGLSCPPKFVGLPDGQLARHVANLAAVLTPMLFEADVVVGPRMDDGHSDHRAAAMALRLALGALRHPPLKWDFGVWAWTHLPERQLNLASARGFQMSPEGLDAKRCAMRAYLSQTTDRFGSVVLDAGMVERFTAPIEVFWP